jgi:hypothetical protein
VEVYDYIGEFARALYRGGFFAAVEYRDIPDRILDIVEEPWKWSREYAEWKSEGKPAEWAPEV